MRSPSYTASIVLINIVLCGAAFGSVLDPKASDQRSATVASSDTVASYSSSAAAQQTLQPAVTGSASTQTLEGAKISAPLKNIFFGVTSTFHGTPLRDLGSDYTVGRDGKQKATNRNALLFDSEISTGYRLSNTVGIGPVVPFLAFVSRDQGFVIGDLGLKAYNSKTIKIHGLKISTNLIVQAPTSQASRDRNMTWALKSTPDVRYSIPHSSFSVGSWTEMKDYFGVSSDKTFKLWALPYLNYALSDRFSLNLGYEMEWHHNVGQKGFGFNTYMTDLQPGFIAEVLKGVYVNPYVAFYTNTGGLDSDHAAIGAFISAAIL